jgi:hypothetical protein
MNKHTETFIVRNLAMLEDVRRHIKANYECALCQSSNFRKTYPQSDIDQHWSLDVTTSRKADFRYIAGYVRGLHDATKESI